MRGYAHSQSENIDLFFGVYYILYGILDISDFMITLKRCILRENLNEMIQNRGQKIHTSTAQ